MLGVCNSCACTHTDPCIDRWWDNGMAEVEIKSGHWTFSNHFLEMSGQINFSMCMYNSMQVSDQ